MKRGRPHAGGPGTMIVLDPDLDPDPAPATATKPVAPDLPANLKATRVPSERTLARFLGVAQAAVRLRGQVTVLLTTDAAIRKLNRRFRGKNKATDVLSFPAGQVHGEAIAGDLAIGIPTALRQAAEQGHSLAVEIKVLVLHGLLHLAGYDHEIDEGKMARRERLLRARLSLPQGLIERATSGAKAQTPRGAVSARLKSCPDTKPSSRSRVPCPEGAHSILRPGKPQKLTPKKVGPVAGGRS